MPSGQAVLHAAAPLFSSPQEVVVAEAQQYIKMLGDFSLR